MLYVTNKFLWLLMRALCGIHCLNILVGSLETPHVTYLRTCTTVNVYYVHEIATALLKKLTMVLELLELTKPVFVVYGLKLQNIWWLQVHY